MGEVGKGPHSNSACGRQIRANYVVAAKLQGHPLPPLVCKWGYCVLARYPHYTSYGTEGSCMQGAGSPDSRHEPHM